MVYLLLIICQKNKILRLRYFNNMLLVIIKVAHIQQLELREVFMKKKFIEI